MATFKFKLEPVLKQRRILEDQGQRELAKLLRQRMILHDQLRSMQRTITESKRALTGTLLGTVNLEQAGRFARYSDQVTQRARSIVLELAQLEKSIEASRQQFLAVSRDRKAIELLRDRRLEAWKKQRRRAEDTVVDEIATQRYVRGEIARIAS